MNSERYTFTEKPPTGLEPATLFGNLPSLTTRPKGLVYKLGSFTIHQLFQMGPISESRAKKVDKDKWVRKFVSIHSKCVFK